MAPNGDGRRKAPPAAFHPSLWGNFFLTYQPPTAPQCSDMKGRADVLREEVRKVIKGTHELPKMLDLVITLQRFGLDIYYENEINELLHIVLHNSDYDDHDLHLVSLRFYLLRNNGYDVSPDVFMNFKDNEGNFVDNNTSSILSLYNAAYLRKHGEEVLNEAITFTTSHLKDVLEQLEPSLANDVSLSLQAPLFRRSRIVEMRNYIPIYEMKGARNESILELAKLNFNLLQLMYCEELNKLTLWWKELQEESKLCFSRDRIVEMHFWMNGACFEHQYSHSRIILTKITAFMTILDDIFDTYATTEESLQLAEAIYRWDQSASELLPEYLKVFYMHLLETFHSFEDELGPEKSHRVFFLKEVLKRLVEAYSDELKWRDEGCAPETMEAHLEVSTRSSGGFTLASASIFIAMADTAATEHIFEWILSYPPLFKSFDLFVRLFNDIVSTKREQTGEHHASTILCYMKEHGATMQEACEKMKELIECQWKELVEHCVAPTAAPEQPVAVARTVVDFARTVDTMYMHGDGITSSHGIKETIASLYVVPVACCLLREEAE